MKNSEFSPNCVNRSLEKFVKKDPEVSAPEFDGMVNFKELAPEALTPVSSAGVVAPERMPELLPYVPEISEAVSKPTHLITPGCAHRVEKLCAPTGGDEIVTVADALLVPPEPVQARLKVLVLVKATVDWLPEIALVPVHPPEAVQEVTLVEDQVSIEVPPLVTDVGFAASDKVGVVAGAEAELAVPPPQAESTEAITGTSSMAFARNIGILIR